jgi:hypothetical protein
MAKVVPISNVSSLLRGASSKKLGKVSLTQPTEEEVEDDRISIASSSIHSEGVDVEQEALLQSAQEAVKKKSKFINARNQLRDSVLKEVLAAVMPDVGSYDIDGMSRRSGPDKSTFRKVMKFLGWMDLDLHEAVLSGSVYHVRRSIKNIMRPGGDKEPNPALMNQYDEQGRSPLSLAVKIKNSDMVLTLLENESLPDVCDEATGRTPLIFSVLGGTLNISAILLKFSASVDMPDFQCVTPLMLACSLGDVKHCQLLCSRLAEVDAQDENGWSPLHYAVKANSPAVITLLLKEGANRSIRDLNRRRPLDLARFFDFGECIALLSSLESLF